MRMPAMRVLVNTPAPQGSTGITTNVFPSMTLGCGAMAGNSTSDNVGPLHLINIKRLAYTVRTPEQAFEMPLDYDKAPDGPVPAGGGRRNRSRGRGFGRGALSRLARHRRVGAGGDAASAGASCGCSTPAPAQASAVRGGQRGGRSGGSLSGAPRRRSPAGAVPEIRRL